MKIPIVGNIDLKSLVIGVALFWALDTFVLKEALAARAYTAETQNTLNWSGTPGHYDLS